jgi:hypothetical protein
MSSAVYMGVYEKYSLFVSVFKQNIRYLCPSLSRTVVCLKNSVKPASITFGPIDFFRHKSVGVSTPFHPKTGTDSVSETLGV